jgi:hypothetical protein
MILEDISLVTSFLGIHKWKIVCSAVQQLVAGGYVSGVPDDYLTRGVAECTPDGSDRLKDYIPKMSDRKQTTPLTEGQHTMPLRCQTDRLIRRALVEYYASEKSDTIQYSNMQDGYFKGCRTYK